MTSGAWVLVAGLLGFPGTLGAQDGAWANAATESLVRRAQARHRVQGEDLSGYTAEIVTRSVGTIGATRWAPDVAIVTHEMLARMQWQRPNELRVDVLGVRSRSVRLPGVSQREVAGFWTEVLAGEPWFAPRFLGDEIQLIGVPDRAARHPLAPDGERWYRYSAGDTVVLRLPRRTVRAVAVEVRPRTAAPFPLLTGRIWLDRDSLDLVRMTGALTGPGLWEDDDDESPVLDGLEIDLEYGLHEVRWWLPVRQVVTTHWHYRYLPGAALTAIATTTFRDIHLAPDSAIVFRTSGDRRRGQWSVWTCDFAGSGRRCGTEGIVRSRRRNDGRWEVVVPPLDSVLAHPFDSAFALHADLLDDEALTQRLIAMSTWSARAPGGSSGLRSIDLSPFESFGFDRVRGASLGVTGALALTGPWLLTVSPRVATHHPFATGEAGLARNDASGRLDVMAVRRLATVEPWSPAAGLGRSLKAALLGHDDADWYLAEGGVVTWRGYRGRTAGWRMSAAVERHASLTGGAGSVAHDVLFGDGDFQPNPPVGEGWMTRFAAQRTGRRWRAGADVLAGDHGLGARVWAVGTAGPLRVMVGTTALDVLPQQEFRLGGPWTVRGFTYGIRRSRHLWAAQLDWPVAVGPYVNLIPFGDVAGGFDGRPLAGIGLGVADSEGLVRLDVAVGLAPEVRSRVDLRITVH